MTVRLDSKYFHYCAVVSLPLLLQHTNIIIKIPVLHSNLYKCWKSAMGVAGTRDARQLLIMTGIIIHSSSHVLWLKCAMFHEEAAWNYNIQTSLYFKNNTNVDDDVFYLHKFYFVSLLSKILL